MSRGRTIAGNTLILLFGTFYTKLAQYLLLPLCTRILSAEEYGEIELFNTVTLLFVPLVTMQLEQGLFRYLVTSRENLSEKKSLISTSIITLFIIMAFCTIIMFVFSSIIESDLKWIMLASVFLNSIFTLLLQIARGMGSSLKYSISNIICSTVTIALNLLLLLGFNMKVDGMIYGSLVGLVVGIVYLFASERLYRYMSMRSYKIQTLKKLLRYSLPLLPNTLAWWVFSSSDKVLVSNIIGLSENGLLSVAYKFSSLLILIYNVFHMSFTESMIASSKDADFESYYNKVFTLVSQLFISCAGIFIAFMSLSFSYIVGQEYEESYGLIPVAILATVFQVFAGLLATQYIVRRKTKSIAITSIASAMINLVVDLILINLIGAYAAVISTLVSFGFLFIYRLIEVDKKYTQIRVDNRLMWNLCFIFLVSTPLFYLNNIYLNVANLFLSILAAVFFNAKSFSTIMHTLKEKGRRRKTALHLKDIQTSR